jgi:hypothetical protein
MKHVTITNQNRREQACNGKNLPSNTHKEFKAKASASKVMLTFFLSPKTLLLEFKEPGINAH